uniref:thioredoxin-dependent peroxiredoxin n=1 Tax=Coptotermes formosanus TaxID=36987 RepID=L0AUK5_COPFO|nr:thioredoxin peroxidase [Coptotermes formosanus]
MCDKPKCDKGPCEKGPCGRCYFKNPVRVGEKLFNFEGTAVLPSTEFSKITSEQLLGKWTVLFSYPLDFTFVCPTEIIAFSEAYDSFQAINTEVIGISVDSVYSHLAWINTPRSEGGIGSIKYSIIGDLGGNICKQLGFYLCEAGHALRGTAIIDPQGIVRHISMNHPDVGRSIEEVLRLVKGYQFAAKHGEVCPASWNEGSDTIVPKPNESKSFFKKNY